MINLLPNHPTEQSIFVTPQDVISRPSDDIYRLVFRGSMGQASFDIVPRIINEVDRYTELGIFTNENDFENGKALITEDGEYTYEITLNGEVLEMGSMIIGNVGTQSYRQQDTNNIVYYG